MNRFMTISAIFTLALIQHTAYAGVPTDEFSTVTVRFTDLNLENTAGAAVVYRRLQHAAEVVCSPLQGGDLSSKARFGRCTAEAVASSIAKMDRPMLTQYYRSVVHSRNAPALLANK